MGASEEEVEEGVGPKLIHGARVAGTLCRMRKLVEPVRRGNGVSRG